MIVLDTNVLSELMRRAPNARVVQWVDSIHAGTLWTTSISIMELRSGIERVADQALRCSLEASFQQRVAADFIDRVAPFDIRAGHIAGGFLGILHALQLNPDVRDVQIAAICSALGASLATRNTRHFHALPIRTIDPWTAPPRPPLKAPS